jgi:hypothetical protein
METSYKHRTEKDHTYSSVLIDMREGNIKYHFPLNKGIEHFPRKRKNLPFDSIIRVSYASSLENT